MSSRVKEKQKTCKSNANRGPLEVLTETHLSSSAQLGAFQSALSLAPRILA